jgi:hypothetical protein
MCAMSPCKSSVILLACVVGAGVTACGSSSGAAAGSASATSSAPASSSSAPAATGGSAASQAVAANWTAFFSAKTPVAKRVSLLQDGQQFSSIIKSQAGSGLASEATAKVTSVSVSSSSKAAVTYSILVAGQAALSGQKGVAVKEDGTWKVGLASFCGLLALENGGKTSGLPSACNSAG